MAEDAILLEACANCRASSTVSSNVFQCKVHSQCRPDVFHAPHTNLLIVLGDLSNQKFASQRPPLQQPCRARSQCSARTPSSSASAALIARVQLYFLLDPRQAPSPMCCRDRCQGRWRSQVDSRNHPRLQGSASISLPVLLGEHRKYRFLDVPFLISNLSLSGGKPVKDMIGDLSLCWRVLQSLSS